MLCYREELKFLRRINKCISEAKEEGHRKIRICLMINNINYPNVTDIFDQPKICI